MVSRFCKQFSFYSGITVYIISRIIPKGAVMIRLWRYTKFLITREYAIFGREVIQLPHNQRGKYKDIHIRR